MQRYSIEKAINSVPEHYLEPWERLAATVPDHRVFASPQWFDACWQWRQHEAGTELVVLFVRGEDGELVLVLPLLRATHQRYRLSVRQVEYLTVPDTQFCPLIASPALSDSDFQAIALLLFDHLPAGDMMLMKRVPEGNPAIGFLQCLFRGRASLTIDAPEANYRIDLCGGWDAFYKAKSRRLKKGNNLVRNKLQASCSDLTIDVAVGAEEATPAVDRLVQTSADSWKGREGFSLNNPEQKAFISRLTRHAVEKGWLSLWELKGDGATLATEYQLSDGHNVYGLRADFSEAYAELSPGTYLNWQLLTKLFESSCRTYYLGAGENAYKLRWTEAFDPLLNVTAYARTPRGLALRAIEKAKPMVKQLLRMPEDSKPA